MMTGAARVRDGSTFSKFLVAAAVALVGLLLLLRMSGEPAVQALHRNVRPLEAHACRR